MSRKPRYVWYPFTMLAWGPFDFRTVNTVIQSQLSVTGKQQNVKVHAG